MTDSTRRGRRTPPAPRTAPGPGVPPTPYRHGVGGVTLHLRGGGCITLYRQGVDVTLNVTGPTDASGTVVLGPDEAEALAGELRRG
jgi:hypothetical protein